MQTGSTRRWASVLWLLLGLFCLRVAGQIVVALYAPSFLPQIDEWYSGLIPYGPLLVAQLAIIMLFTKICIDFTRGNGFFVCPRPAFGRDVLALGYLYFASMVVRYVVRMALYPDERWLGGCIPILFHWVLASFVIAFALYHRAKCGSKTSARHRTTLPT